MNASILTLIAVVALILLSAAFSGLTLGLLSLNVFELKRKAELGDKEAARVYPIRKRGNELLVALIIGNVFVNSALTVMLNSFLAGAIAVVISTVLITVFGEILPQALLKKHGLAFSARFAFYIDKWLLIVKPLSILPTKLLDRTVGGEQPTIYSNNEIVKIIEEHEESKDSDIEEDELRIVANALNFGDKLIEDVMTPKSVVMTVKSSDVIGPILLEELHESGNSRFPVLDKGGQDIIGLLYIRNLIQIGSSKKTKVRDVMEDKVYFVNEKEKLDHALNAFIRTKNHLFVVVNEFSEMVGVITIEDIIEEIIGQEIVDEFDKYGDMRAVAKIRGKKASKNTANTRE